MTREGVIVLPKPLSSLRTICRPQCSWDPLRRVFDAFGFDRCLWGTDWTRAVNLLTYEQGVTPFRLTDRLSDDERADIMGGALQRIYNWAPEIT